MANEYASVLALRERLGLADSGDDGQFARVLEAASRAIDGLCGRRFYQDSTVSARTLTTTYGQGCIYLPPGWDISTSSGLIVTSSAGTWTIGTHFRLEPDAGIGPTGEAWPYTALHGIDGEPITLATWSATITAKWGWPSVPTSVVEATLIAAADLWKLKDAPFGVAGFGDYGAVRVRQNRRVVELAGPYRHGRAVVGIA